MAGFFAWAFSPLVGIGLLGGMSALQLSRNAFKKNALEHYEAKKNTPKLSAKERNAFKIGTKAAKTWTAQFNSVTQRDAYNLKPYYAGFAAQENDENPALIKRVLGKRKR